MKQADVRRACAMTPVDFCYRPLSPEVFVVLCLLAPAAVVLLIWLTSAPGRPLYRGDALLGAAMALLLWGVAALWWWGFWAKWSLSAQGATMQITWRLSADNRLDRTVRWTEAGYLRIGRSALWPRNLGGGLDVVLGPVHEQQAQSLDLHISNLKDPALAVGVIDELLGRVPARAIHPEVLVLRDMIDRATKLRLHLDRGACAEKAAIDAASMRLVRAARALRRLHNRALLGSEERAVLAQTLFLLGRRGPALAMCEEYLKDSPADWSILLCRVLCLSRLRNIDDTRRALGELPEHGDTHTRIVREFAGRLR